MFSQVFDVPFKMAVSPRLLLLSPSARSCVRFCAARSQFATVATHEQNIQILSEHRIIRSDDTHSELRGPNKRPGMIFVMMIDGHDDEGVLWADRRRISEEARKPAGTRVTR